MVTRKAAAAALVLAATWVSPATARAQESDRAVPDWIYGAFTGGGGYFHFWQLFAVERDAGGGVVSLHATIGGRISREVAIGGAIAAWQGFAIWLVEPTEEGEVPYAPMGMFGAALAVLPDGPDSVVTYEGMLGFGGGVGSGPTGSFGGYGPSMSHGLLFHVAGEQGVHLTLAARVYVGLWSSDDYGGFRPLLGGVGEIGCSLF